MIHRVREKFYHLAVHAVDAIWERTQKPQQDFQIFLGRHPIPGSPVAIAYPQTFWNKRTLAEKLGALFAKNWWPSEREKSLAGEDILLADLFGEDDDCGHDLLKINAWVGRRPWDLSSLTDHDTRRAHALEVNAAALHTQYKGLTTFPPLNLRLKTRAPGLWTILYPMAIKVPVLSVRYFVDVHARLAFQHIRQSKHPAADDIVSFLYDILALQQKTAFAIFRFLELSAENMKNKGDALLTKHELDAFAFSEAAIGHLKATTEKIIAMLGVLFGAKSLDSKKTQKARLNALREAVPADVFTTFYAELLMQMVDSENLQPLNDIRTGLLHKRGAADFQPHSYVGVAGNYVPHLKIFALLHEQHSMNSAALVAALAILADDLVRRLPPEGPPEGYFREFDELMRAVVRSREQVAHSPTEPENGAPV